MARSIPYASSCDGPPSAARHAAVRGRCRTGWSATAASRGASESKPAPLFQQPVWDALGVVLAAELRRLGLTFVPGFLQDRGDLGVGDEALPTVRIPVEEHPD